MTAILVFVLLVILPLLSLLVESSDFDDRDRRGWFPGTRVH